MQRDCTTQSGAETGCLNADHGRQDKSAAFGRAHVVGWIGDFRYLAHSACWRLSHKYQRFQCPKRHTRDPSSPIQ